MTAIALVSVINPYYINGLHLFRDTHINGVKKKEYTSVSQQLEILTFSSMNTQSVAKYKNGKKLTWLRE